MANRFTGFLRGLRGSTTPPKPAPTKTVGAPGFSAYGGYVVTAEKNAQATGDQKWRNYADIVSNFSIVAAGTRHFLGLIARTSWQVEPAKDIDGEDSSDAAKEAAEFVETVLHDMATPWAKVMRRSAMYRFNGFGVQEWTAKRTDDGRIGFKDVYVRPCHTVKRWDLDDNGEILGIFQTPPQTGQELYLPRWKTIYLVDDSLTDSPEGMGLFRHLLEPAKALKEYLRLEGTGFQRDLRGIPIGRAPLAALREAVDAGEITQEQSDAMILALENLVKMQAKTHETGAIVDSAPYKAISDTGETYSSVAQWAIDLLTGNATGIEYLGKAIDRLNREMARVLAAEHLMLGDGSGGNRALSKDKSQNLWLQVEGTLADLSESGEKDIIGSLWRLNGLPDELKPTLKTESVQFKDVEQITASLRDMSTAGATLAPDDPAIDDVRDLLGISRQPELDPEMVAAMNRQRLGVPDPNDLDEPGGPDDQFDGEEE